LASSTAASEASALASLPDRVSKFVGVTWNRRAQIWEVRIYAQGRNTYIGSFDNETEAARK
jgi:hypothetical protein